MIASKIPILNLLIDFDFNLRESIILFLFK